MDNDDLFQGKLGASQISDIAKLIGAGEEETRNAIAAAIPTLLGGIGRAAETDDGIQKIASQMQGIRGNGLDDLFSNLPKARPSSLDGALGPGNELESSDYSDSIPPRINPGNAGTTGRESRGGGMLDDIFGGKTKKVEDAIGKSSGLDLRKIGPLLAILAPIVLSALKSRAASASTRSSGSQLNNEDIRDVLRGERRRVESQPGGGILGRIFDQDGDGDFDFSDILKLGMSFLMGGRR